MSIPSTNPSHPRLDQLLSRLGYCSRREVKYWLSAGRVLVAGQPTRSAEQKVDPALVQVDGAPLDTPEGLLILLHKPAGVVCSHEQGEGPRVYDLLPERWNRRNPAPTSIGRLDKDTTGCLLITDQLPLVHALTSPKRLIDKVYEVTVDKPLDPSLVDLFKSGTLRLASEHEPCLSATLTLLAPCQARVVLHEGRYHQVKRMFAACGYHVVSLHRSHFGPYSVDGLLPGTFELLNLPIKGVL